MMNSPFIVALTGGIASGKSTIEKIFVSLGVPTVDADTIARTVIAKNTPAFIEIVHYFGQSILDETGDIDRTALRKRVFNCPYDRDWLNALVHPLVERTTLHIFSSIKSDYVLWVIPLLIENNLQNYANHILVVDSLPNLQLERLKKRDKIDEKLAKNMLLSQASREVRNHYADDIIHNNAQFDELKSQVFMLHQKYLGLAKNHNTKRAD